MGVKPGFRFSFAINSFHNDLFSKRALVFSEEPLLYFRTSQVPGTSIKYQVSSGHFFLIPVAIQTGEKFHILIGFFRYLIRIGWKWTGMDCKGYANTTYISYFHPQIQIFDFWSFLFDFVSFFIYLGCFETQNLFYATLADQSRTGVG